MRNFHELQVWIMAHVLVLKIYKISKTFPKDEMFGFTSQMRRPAASIPTNIAEGCGRNTNPDFKRFLSISTGSSSELEYQLLLARDLEYLYFSHFTDLTNDVIEIRKMLNSFSTKLK